MQTQGRMTKEEFEKEMIAVEDDVNLQARTCFDFLHIVPRKCACLTCAFPWCGSAIPHTQLSGLGVKRTED